jgi:methyl-accepting chemotaxis protein
MVRGSQMVGGDGAPSYPITSRNQEPVLQNIAITQKIILLLALLGIFVLGVAVYVSGQMRHMDDSYSALMSGNDTATVDAARASRSLEAARSAIAVTQIATDPANLAQLKVEMDESLSRFTHFMTKAAAAAPAHAAALNEITASGIDVISNQCAQSFKDGYAASTDAQTLEAQKEYLVSCEPKFPPILQAISTLNEQMIAETSKQHSALTATTGRTITLTYGGIIGGLIVVGLIAFGSVRRWIITPLRAQLDIMARLAAGDYGAEVAGTERRDEVGAIARAVAVFRDSGQEKLRLEAETAAQRARAEDDRGRREAQQVATVQQNTFVVASLAAGLEKLSSGDLLFRIETPFSSEYESLRADFNAAMGKLQETMSTIARTTQGVRSGSSEITQASDDLARRTEQQAASLEQTAAALDQITATVRRTAESAQEARTTAASAKSDAEHSGVVVNDTVTAMSAIEASARQIGNIIGVIDEIAFQTNLLALNAGVEAARAGDAGRGFAVVATEVRALAQRSADAAKEIKALISASGKQVDSGKALARIVGQVERLNGLVGDIAGSAQEQATGLVQVNTAVNQMDQVTQQNAAMVEQATAASHSLGREAEALAQLVAQFNIGGGSADQSGPGQRRSSPAHKTSRPGRTIAQAMAEAN